MPIRTARQWGLMAAAAHDPEVAAKTGVKSSVAREFVKKTPKSKRSVYARVMAKIVKRRKKEKKDPWTEDGDMTENLMEYNPDQPRDDNGRFVPVGPLPIADGMVATVLAHDIIEAKKGKSKGAKGGRWVTIRGGKRVFIGGGKGSIVKGKWVAGTKTVELAGGGKATFQRRQRAANRGSAAPGMGLKKVKGKITGSGVKAKTKMGEPVVKVRRALARGSTPGVKAVRKSIARQTHKKGPWAKKRRMGTKAPAWEDYPMLSRLLEASSTSAVRSYGR